MKKTEMLNIILESDSLTNTEKIEAIKELKELHEGKYAQMAGGAAALVGASALMGGLGWLSHKMVKSHMRQSELYRQMREKCQHLKMMSDQKTICTYEALIKTLKLEANELKSAMSQCNKASENKTMKCKNKIKRRVDQIEERIHRTEQNMAKFKAKPSFMKKVAPRLRQGATGASWNPFKYD